MPIPHATTPALAAVCLAMLTPGSAATGAVRGESHHSASEVIWQWDGPIPENPEVTASLRLYAAEGGFRLTVTGSRGRCVVNIAVAVVSAESWRLYQRCATGTVVGDVIIDGTYSVSRVQRSASGISFDFSFSGVVWDEIIAIWPSTNTRGLTLGRLAYTWQPSGTLTAPQPVPTPPATERTYQIVAQYSGKCVDVAGVAVESGAPVHQWDCLGSQQRNQVWLLRPVGNGLFMVIAQHSNKCMDVEGQSPANGARVIQWDCLFQQANQLWSVRGLSGGRIQLVASHSGKCLTLSGPSTENGGRFLQWDCDPSNQPGQPFTLHPIP